MRLRVSFLLLRLARGVDVLSVKFLLQVDDAVDIFALHGVGGIVGLLLNACLSDSSIMALDNVSQSQGGWLNRNWYAANLGHISLGL